MTKSELCNVTCWVGQTKGQGGKSCDIDSQVLYRAINRKREVFRLSRVFRDLKNRHLEAEKNILKCSGTNVTL